MSAPVDHFHLELSAYLGADPDAVAASVCENVTRLAAVRDGRTPAAALAEAEGTVVAALAFLESVVGPDDLAEALARTIAGCRRRAARDAAMFEALTRGKKR